MSKLYDYNDWYVCPHCNSEIHEPIHIGEFGSGEYFEKKCPDCGMTFFVVKKYEICFEKR